MSKDIARAAKSLAIALSLSASIAYAGSAETVSDPAEKAPFLRYSAPMLPIMYGYASCLYRDQSELVEVRIETCQSDKSDWLILASPVMGQWHARRAETRMAELTQVLSDLEDEARFAASSREPLPETLVEYMRCTSAWLVGRERCKKGLVIEYRRADNHCKDPVRAEFKGQNGVHVRYMYERMRLTDHYRRPLAQFDRFDRLPDVLITDDDGMLTPRGEN